MNKGAKGPLSPRQAEIAALVARGKSSREIARTLYLSPRTVDVHIAAILEKWEMRSRLELATWLLAGDEGPGGESARISKTNLPLSRSSLIGREAEIADIVGTLRKSKLVTVTGAGGVGKTRVALAAGEALFADAPNGVWMVELAPIARSGWVASATAQALGVQASPSRPLMDSLIAHLKQRSLVLILDNCEHVIAEAAAFTDALLRGCRYVQIIATSREPLRVDGERAYRLPSLRVPTAAEARDLRPSAATAFAAVVLFEERARASDPHFELSAQTAPIVGDMCRRLDGIPLAIELAASRVRFLGLRQLRDRLNERFGVLTRGCRAALPRHQTIRGLIDWSHDLLDESERRLFRRLGIFSDGFTLDAASAVGDENESNPSTLEVLAALVDKSLVVAETGPDTTRYRLLESTRAYACEKLAAAGEHHLVSTRHLTFLRDAFAQLRDHADRTGRSSEVDDAFAAELNNIRSALDNAANCPDIRVAAELLANIQRNWLYLGLSSEGIKRIERVLPALTRSEPRLLAGLLETLAGLLYESGQYEFALEVATQAVSHARTAGDAAVLALALRSHSNASFSAGKLGQAGASLAQAEAFADLPTALRLSLLRSRARLEYLRGDFEAAVHIDEQLLKAHRSIGDIRGERLTMFHLARHELGRGRTFAATEIIRETALLCRAAGDKWLLPFSLVILAACLTCVDDLKGATLAASEAIELWTDVEPGHPQIALAIEVQALVFALRGDLERAAELAAYADASFARHGYNREPHEMATRVRLTVLLRDGLPLDELERLTAAGAARTPDAAFALTRHA